MTFAAGTSIQSRRDPAIDANFMSRAASLPFDF